MPAESCHVIVENILAYDDAAELEDFLGAFTEKTAETKVSEFVEALFDRRNGKVPAEENVVASCGVGGADSQRKGKGSSGGGDGGKGRGRGGRGGGSTQKSSKEKEDDFPRLLMPTRPKNKADKRLMVIDAASGRHKILTNCLNCGKVIAESEGWGPCLFCGNPLEVGDRFGLRHGDDRGMCVGEGTNREEDEKVNESFGRAVSMKDRLLSYDRDARRRTKVYNDDTDWYSESVNPWLTEKQREQAAQNAKDEERRQRDDRRRVHAKIDIFGRTVIDGTAEVEEEKRAKNRENFEAWTDNVAETNKFMAMYEESQKGISTSQLSGDSKQLYDKLRASLHAAGGKAQMQNGHQSERDMGSDKKGKQRWDASQDPNRIEDEFSCVSMGNFAGAVTGTSDVTRLLPQEESPYGDDADSGQCLSMYQPWASLLVQGFKRAEGRSWKTDHRGRLWIHAAAKPPDQADIKSVEDRYREIYKSRGIPTPAMPSEGSGYPTSALLGCVDIEQCWSNEEYRSVLKSDPSMPPEENDNDYIFWCLRPRRLVVPVKMAGDHKIWRLPKASMLAAQRALQPARWPALADNGDAVPSVPEGRLGSRGIDLYPTQVAEEILEVVERDRECLDRDVVVLQNGFVHLVGFVRADLQQQIVDTLRDVGMSAQGFFEEHFDGVKVSSNVSRMYLGRHWNSVSQKWENSRGNLDGVSPPELPKLLIDIYGEALRRANRDLKSRKLKLLPDGRLPDVAVVNFFEPAGSMQEHQDKTESKASIDAKLPVMGICIGDACDFAYGTDAPTTTRKPKTVRLESGDVYLFGGEARLLWHGVSKIVPRTAPPSLRLLPGRLSITLKAS
eukprot:TRINITY_DN5917_c0_g1_i1.p1 TRINITY_DN5917_c0_g1~~TRINITY_DN5917_c0_g1_i1.p1  ORF type:complete len:894 (+),score=168.51 TRINITY_DN5917_c0_g1_i1:157-2682(+)